MFLTLSLGGEAPALSKDHSSYPTRCPGKDISYVLNVPSCGSNGSLKEQPHTFPTGHLSGHVGTAGYRAGSRGAVVLSLVPVATAEGQTGSLKHGTCSRMHSR